MRRCRIFVAFVTMGGLAIPFATAARAQQGPTTKPASRRTVRDILWIWGNPEMAKPGPHTVATYAQASTAERAKLLGAPNVMMAGDGLPNDDKEADRLTESVAHCKRILWEIGRDGNKDDHKRPWVYDKRMAQVRRLADKYPKIEGVILDDMSTVARSRGFAPKHIRRIRELLPGKYRKVKIWGVVYTMSLGDKGINDYVKELDVIMLAVWHAKDVVDIEKYVAHCEKHFPGKPICACFYLYDYGAQRKMPPDLLKKQCQLALELAGAGRIEGIEFTTIGNDAKAVGWTAEWVKRVGDRKLEPKRHRP